MTVIVENTTNITVNASEPIIVRTPTYFTNLTDVFAAANERYGVVVFAILYTRDKRNGNVIAHSLLKTQPNRKESSSLSLSCFLLSLIM